jgi:hypothetical protein
MLQKLQRKTLIPAQIIGYAITLLVGVAIVVLVFQLYADIKPLLTQQTDVFKSHAVTVSKPVTLFKTFDKSKLGFSQEELEELQRQEFVKKVAAFTSASFHVSASINFGPQGSMYTELFFESVPDEFLDVTSERWEWHADSQFLPIIIPEDYLNLYNFGFAESQSLPVVSQSTIEQIPFNIHVEGNGKHRDYKSNIVGFSNKINTILVPDDFLQWANQEYGKPNAQNVTRLLVEFTDASDERIPAYFESHGFDLKENELQSSKLMFFFKVALSFVFSVAAIIIILSMAFIVMSMNLIVQKNRELFVNLYNIGYSPKQIARFYQVVISAITFIDIVLATFIAMAVRKQYLNRLSSLFDTVSGSYTMWITAGIIALLLLMVYHILIKRNIKKCITNE